MERFIISWILVIQLRNYLINEKQKDMFNTIMHYVFNVLFWCYTVFACIYTIQEIIQIYTGVDLKIIAEKPWTNQFTKSGNALCVVPPAGRLVYM
jgi:hypothetical protein